MFVSAKSNGIARGCKRGAKVTFPQHAPIRSPEMNWVFPNVQSARLSNGLLLNVLTTSRLPFVQMRLMIPGGRHLEPISVAPGVGALAMRTARYGTSSYDARQLALGLDELGSQLGCRSSLDALSFGLQSLTKNLRTSLKIFSEVLQVPRFDALDVTREAEKLAATKRNQASRPSGYAGQWLNGLLYGEHPYGSPASTAEEILSCKPESLKRYFEQRVRPDGAYLVVVGDIDFEEARGLFEDVLGSWTGTVGPSEPPELPVSDSTTRIVLLDRPGAQQSMLFMGALGLQRSHPDYLALSVLNHIFGGGASGRLFKDLREARSLTYGCSSVLDSGMWGGDLTASLSCSPGKTQEALEALLGQYERLCTQPVLEEELASAIQYRIGAWPKAGASLRGLAGLVLVQLLNRLDKDCWTEHPHRLRTLTVEALERVAKRHLNYSAKRLVVVGEASKLQGCLEGLGELCVYSGDARPLRKAHQV